MRRALVDTNVIVSALIFPESAPARALWAVIENDQLVLTGWILKELHDVIGRKWPERLAALDQFLANIDYELLDAGLPSAEVRDANDQPILDAAVSGHVDMIITGDKDFLALRIARPVILTARDYLDLGGDKSRARGIEE